MPIDTLPLFPVLDELLLELLRSLTPADWQRPTLARQWSVKDVAAHLLDGNLRTLSMLRDGHFGEATDDTSYAGLVADITSLTRAAAGDATQFARDGLHYAGPQLAQWARLAQPIAQALVLKSD